MRKLALLIVIVAAASAWAGELFVGRMFVSDAGSVNNASTGYLTAGCALQTSSGGAGACDQAFALGVCQKLTLQAVDPLYVSVNRSTTDAGIGMLLGAGEKFPTSLSCQGIPVGSLATTIGGMPDGGSYVGGIVTIAPAVGATSARLNVFTRSGTE